MPGGDGALAALDSKVQEKGSCIRNRWFARREKADQRRYDDRNSSTVSQTDGRHSDQCSIQDLQGKKVEKKKVISVQMITKKNVEQTDISRWQ